MKNNLLLALAAIALLVGCDKSSKDSVDTRSSQLKEDLAPKTKLTSDECFASWAVDFRKDFGEEAIIPNHAIEEFDSACNKGQLPSEASVLEALKTNEWYMLPGDLDLSITLGSNPECVKSEPPSEYIKAVISQNDSYTAKTLLEYGGIPLAIDVTTDRGTGHWVRGKQRCSSVIQNKINVATSTQKEKFQEADRYK